MMLFHVDRDGYTQAEHKAQIAQGKIKISRCALQHILQLLFRGSRS